MVKRVIAAAGLLALAACGSGESGGNGSAAAGKGGTSAVAGGGGVQLQPGEWETTTQMVKVEGMPKEVAAMMMKEATKGRNCITPEELKEANAGLFGGEEQKNCKREGFAFQNGRISGKLSCTGEGGEGGTSSMEMSGQYSATTYDVTARISTNVQGMSANMESRTQGRRIGDCPPGGEDKGG